MSTPVIVVVAYDDKVREVLVSSLARFEATVIPCESFCQAESHLLVESCQGLLVDLVTMIKAKGEEKVVAFTLTSRFPTLRVRTMGSMLVPMTMSGDAAQDKNLNDFMNKSCLGYAPRRLRFHKRRDFCLPVLIGTSGSEPSCRSFTQNISWGGVFIVDLNPERFQPGAAVCVFFPDFELTVEAVVAWSVPWGRYKPPGLAIRFTGVTKELKGCLTELLQTSEDADHDRLSS